jgi:dihydrofolate reductase
MRRELLVCVWLVAAASLIACGARQAQPSTAEPGEVTIEQGSLVIARRGAEAGLPPLPQALPATSADFQRGYALALDLLADPGPMPPPDTDAAAYEHWTKGEFSRWIAGRGRAVEELVTPLQRVAQGPASEHVIAAALLGLIYQRTYEQFMLIAPPPGLRDDPWRRLPKWVVSRSLSSVGPNATLVSDDVEATITRLKAQLDGEIDVAGPDLAQSLADLGLIDEYRLYFHPVVLGRGKPFFAGPRPPLRLVASDRIGESVIRLTYVPDA